MARRLRVGRGQQARGVGVQAHEQRADLEAEPLLRDGVEDGSRQLDDERDRQQDPDVAAEDAGAHLEQAGDWASAPVADPAAPTGRAPTGPTG